MTKQGHVCHLLNHVYTTLVQKVCVKRARMHKLPKLSYLITCIGSYYLIWEYSGKRFVHEHYWTLRSFSLWAPVAVTQKVKSLLLLVQFAVLRELISSQVLVVTW